MGTQAAQARTFTCVANLLSDASTRIGESLALDKPVARLEARVLAAFAWNVAQSWLIAHDTDTLNHEQASCFSALLQRRLAGEPIAYITGEREFYGRAFHVTPAVLIPRPETELLVELALARMPPGQPIQVLELGTGSGCIAISLALERPHASITAIECSPPARSIAQFNMQKLGARMALLESDWFSALQHRKFDLIVSNPPYIADADPHLTQGDVRFEPTTALIAGKEGMDDLHRIISTARTHLKTGGSLLLEHGWNQSLAMRDALRLAGFERLYTCQDMAGIDRVSGGQNPSE